MKSGPIPATSFWRLLGCFTLLLVLSWVPATFMVISSIETIQNLLSIEADRPASWTLSSRDLTAFLMLPMALWVPFAFFPVQWSKSEDASAKRLLIAGGLLVLALAGGLVIRLTAGYVLDAWLHPKGYVECKLDPKQRWDYSRWYLYGLGPENCEFGVKN